MTSHRVERVADLLRQELSQILREEVRDPRVRDASVTRVQVSSDLQHAKVMISVLGEDDQEEALEGLRRASGFVRSRLAGRINLRHVPELRFAIDHGAEHSLRISQLLETLVPDGEGEAEGESADDRGAAADETATPPGSDDRADGEPR